MSLLAQLRCFVGLHHQRVPVRRAFIESDRRAYVILERGQWAESDDLLRCVVVFEARCSRCWEALR